MSRAFFAFAAFALLLGCEDRYQSGYEDGYADTNTEARLAGTEDCQERQPDYGYRTYSSYQAPTRSVTTEVCGGGGVNVDGKHHAPGLTGCVQVFSDGTIER